MSAVKGLVDALERIEAVGAVALGHGTIATQMAEIAWAALAAFREGKPLADDRDMCEAIHGAVMYKRDSPDYRERYGNARAALAFVDAHVLGRRSQGGR